MMLLLLLLLYYYKIGIAHKFKQAGVRCAGHFLSTFCMFVHKVWRQFAITTTADYSTWEIKQTLRLWHFIFLKQVGQTALSLCY